MNPFVRLGVSADADEAQIKRAYAKLLRITRPDDDPAGFQQLNDAYQRCLAWARQRALATADVGFDARDRQAHEDDDDEAGAQELGTWTLADLVEFQPIATEPQVRAPEFDHGPRVVAPPDPAPRPIAIAPAPDPFTRPAVAAGAAAQAAPHPTPRSPDLHEAQTAPVHDAEAAFDLAPFLDELSRTAQTSTPEALQRWLDRHPALYSLANQHAVARELVAHLSYAPSLYIAQLDILLRFFGLDTVGETVASSQMRIDELRARAKACGGDFREIAFQREPRPSERGEHPLSIPWAGIGFFLAMLVLSIAMTMRTAYGG